MKKEMENNRKETKAANRISKGENAVLQKRKEGKFSLFGPKDLSKRRMFA
jgi:hypothetical protein